MYRNKMINILTALILIGASVLFVYGLNFTAGDAGISAPTSQDAPASRALTVRGVIRIDGDTDFTSGNGVSNPAAAGTAANPFVIKDFEIDGSGKGFCIYVGNTTKHFRIQNCDLYDANGKGTLYYQNAAVQLYNVENATVNGSWLSNSGYGLYADMSSGLDIHHNIVSGNSAQGISYIYNPVFVSEDISIDDVVIEFNKVTHSVNDIGIFFEYQLNYLGGAGYEVLIGNISINNNMVLKNGTTDFSIYFGNCDVYNLEWGNITVGDIEISRNTAYGGQRGIYFNEFGFETLNGVNVTAGDVTVDDNNLFGATDLGLGVGYPYWYGEISGDSKMTYGTVSVSGNNVTSTAMGITVYGLGYGYEQYHNSKVFFGETHVNNNTVSSVGTALRVGIAYAGYENDMFSVEIISDLYIYGNDVTSTTSYGIELKYEQTACYQYGNTTLKIGNATIMDNTIKSDSHGIKVYYYEVGFDCQDDSVSVIGDVLVINNSIDAGAIGVCIEFEYYTLYQLTGNAVVRLGDFIIYGNNISAGTYGIYYYMYESGFLLMANCKASIGEFVVYQNIIDSSSHGVYSYYEYVGYDMYGSSQLFFDNWVIAYNDITTVWSGIYVDYYDYVGYSMYGSSNFTMGELVVIDNNITAGTNGVSVYFSSSGNGMATYLYDKASYYQFDMTFSGNNISTTTGFGILIDLYDYYVGSYGYGNSRVRLPDYNVFDNNFTTGNYGFQFESYSSPDDYYENARIYVCGFNIDGNDFLGNDGIYIYLEDVTEDGYDTTSTNVGPIRITNNYFYDMDYHAIELDYDEVGYSFSDWASLNASDILIMGNVMDQIAGSGVYIYNYQSTNGNGIMRYGRTIVADNQISNCTSDGIFMDYDWYLNGGGKVSLDSTWVFNNTIKHVTGDGINFDLALSVTGALTAKVGETVIGNNTILDHTSDGIQYGQSVTHLSGTYTLGNTSIMNNVISSKQPVAYGIDGAGSQYMIVAANTITECEKGIQWVDITDSLFAYNDISGATNAIDIETDSDNCSIFGNNIHDNIYGLLLNQTAGDNGNHSLWDNVFENNYLGLYLNYTDNITVVNNYFDNYINLKTWQVRDTAWNLPKTQGGNIIGGGWLGGNYWSDYPGVDTDGDGLGDTLVPFGPGDNLPLVFDTVKPGITDQTTGVAYTGDGYTFTAQVTDAGSPVIPEVWCEYWSGTGSHTNVSMADLGGDQFSVGITVPLNTLDRLNYRFSARDTTGNWAMEEFFTFPVDNKIPVEINTVYPGSVFQNQPVNITVTLLDNIAIDGVWLNYTDAGANSANVSMTMFGGNYTYEIAGIADLGNLDFSIWFNDTSGNENATQVYTINVLDGQAPAITPAYPASVNVTEGIEITADIVDASGLTDVKLTYWAGTIPSQNVTMTFSSGSYRYTVPGIDEVLTLSFKIWANDTNGNQKETGVLTIDVVDNVVPLVTMVSPAPDGYLSGTAVFVLNASDFHSGVDYVSVAVGTTLFFNETPAAEEFTLEWNTLSVADGEVTITVVAADTAGNLNMTSVNFTVDNTDPLADAGPDQTVLVGEEMFFYGTNSSDANGIASYDWLFFVDGANVTLSGAQPNYTFEARGNYLATLTVYDPAGNMGLDMVTIHVEDPPAKPEVVSTIPADGAVDVELRPMIEIYFSMVMNTTSVEALLDLPADWNYTLTWGGGQQTVVITLNEPLDPATTYTIDIGTVESSLGTTLVNGSYSFSFTTESGTIPVTDITITGPSAGTEFEPGENITVTGTSTGLAGETVTVTLQGAEATGTIGADGTWSVTLTVPDTEGTFGIQAEAAGITATPVSVTIKSAGTPGDDDDDDDDDGLSTAAIAGIIFVILLIVIVIIIVAVFLMKKKGGDEDDESSDEEDEDEDEDDEDEEADEDEDEDDEDDEDEDEEDADEEDADDEEDDEDWDDDEDEEEDDWEEDEE